MIIKIITSDNHSEHSVSYSDNDTWCCNTPGRHTEVVSCTLPESNITIKSFKYIKNGTIKPPFDILFGNLPDVHTDDHVLVSIIDKDLKLFTEHYLSWIYIL